MQIVFLEYLNRDKGAGKSCFSVTIITSEHGKRNAKTTLVNHTMLHQKHWKTIGKTSCFNVVNDWKNLYIQRYSDIKTIEKPLVKQGICFPDFDGWGGMGGEWAYTSEMMGLTGISYMTVMPSAEAVCNKNDTR